MTRLSNGWNHLTLIERQQRVATGVLARRANRAAVVRKGIRKKTILHPNGCWIWMGATYKTKARSGK
jgi:hypothetical protein